MNLIRLGLIYNSLFSSSLGKLAVNQFPLTTQEEKLKANYVAKEKYNIDKNTFLFWLFFLFFLWEWKRNSIKREAAKIF